MDGEFHTKDNSLNGQTKEESKAIDDDKDYKAEENGIKVIRIDCVESNLKYIKDNIYNSDLSKIFDLSKVNWLEVESFALSNLVKIACEHKKSNSESTTSDIGELMKLNRHTIRTYLIKGSKLGWCDYSAKEENFKRNSKISKINSKPVEIFKDNTSIAIFKSVAELERKSEELFGVKLISQSISYFCTTEQKIPHKGFTFKYITQP